jgi:hypothetical protein
MSYSPYSIRSITQCIILFRQRLANKIVSETTADHVEQVMKPPWPVLAGVEAGGRRCAMPERLGRRASSPTIEHPARAVSAARAGFCYLRTHPTHDRVTRLATATGTETAIQLNCFRGCIRNFDKVTPTKAPGLVM